MKNFYIEVDFGEGIPTYNFVIKAIDHETARAIAWKEIDASYPDTDMKYTKMQSSQITAEQLLERLTIN